MKAIVFGASGLVGGALLQQLLTEPRYLEVIIFVRRPLPFQHTKLKQIISSFENLDSYQDTFKQTDALFCCLGTTIHKAKTKENFKKIDYDLPLKLAKLFQIMEGKHFLIITAIGSNAQSPFFYNKTKGQLELALKSLNLKRLSIIRPSLLLGERPESRFFEGLGQKLFPFINPVISPKYRAVSATQVANTLIATSLGQACKSDIEVETI
jgi:uncharacterized protein YbjT (DUF2867 family)